MPESSQPESGTAIAPGVRVPDGVLEWTFARGGGPGGQNVNKTSTRATLTVLLSDLEPHLRQDAMDRLRTLAGAYLAADPDRLMITSGDSRSQHANRKSCLAKLRDLLVRGRHRPKTRRPTRPTRGSVERRLEAKKQRGQIKQTRKNLRRQDG